MHDPCGKPSSRDWIPAGSRLAPLEQAMGSTTGGHDPEGLLKAERHLGCEEPLVTSDSPNTKGPGGDMQKFQVNLSNKPSWATGP